MDGVEFQVANSVLGITKSVMNMNMSEVNIITPSATLCYCPLTTKHLNNYHKILLRYFPLVHSAQKQMT